LGRGTFLAARGTPWKASSERVGAGAADAVGGARHHAAPWAVTLLQSVRHSGTPWGGLHRATRTLSATGWPSVTLNADSLKRAFLRAPLNRDVASPPSGAC